MVLREVGANVSPLPAIPTLVSGALPIARFGSDAQQAILAKVASGDVLLTAALVEIGAEPEKPTTTATRDGDGWRITGTKSNVPGATAAELVLVPASVDGGGVAMFLVPTSSQGITTARQQTMNHEPLFEMELDGVHVGDDALLGSLEQGHGDPRVHTQPHDGRDVRGGVGSRRARAAYDRAVHVRPQAVRPRDRHVPGGRSAHGRLLHRRVGDRAHDAASRDAPRRGARRHAGEVGPPTAATHRAPPTAATASTSTRHPPRCTSEFTLGSATPSNRRRLSETPRLKNRTGVSGGCPRPARHAGSVDGNSAARSTASAGATDPEGHRWHFDRFDDTRPGPPPRPKIPALRKPKPSTRPGGSLRPASDAGSETLRTADRGRGRGSPVITMMCSAPASR